MVRRLRGDLIEVFKMFMRLKDIDHPYDFLHSVSDRDYVVIHISPVKFPQYERRY